MLNRTESKAKAVDIARCLKTRCFAGNNFNEIEDLFGQLLLFVFFVISPYLTASRIAFKLMSVRKKKYISWQTIHFLKFRYEIYNSSTYAISE